MATKRQLNVVLYGFPYGGNSGVQIEHTPVARWRERVAIEAMQDSRIEQYLSDDLCDTPIPMTRNKAVLMARKMGADVLVMIDSDMSPDVHCDQNSPRDYDPTARPFFKTAFDFLYAHYDRGPVCLMAPYGGKGDYENMFVFRWRGANNDLDDDAFGGLEQWTREECFGASGIHDVAAGATGLCMIDMRCFDWLEPQTKDDHAWFDYEWTDKYKSEKASTEDVFFTRNLALHGVAEHGYNPCKVLFDSWAGHNGFKVTKKPKLLTQEHITKRFVRAAQRLGMKKQYDVGNVVTPLAKPAYDATARGACRKAIESLKNTTPAAIAAELEKMRPQLHTAADMAALAQLVVASRREDDVILAVEVGSMLGDSAKAVCAAAEQKIHLLCVDTWRGAETDFGRTVYDELGEDNVYSFFAQNCSAEIHSGAIEPMRTSSLEAAEMLGLAGRLFDIVFIDADHSYEGVKADIEAWLPLVREGGILCGHDFGTLGQANDREMFPGVRQAVTELLPDAQVAQGTSVWMYRVSVAADQQDNPPDVLVNDPELAARAQTNGHAKKPKPKRAKSKAKPKNRIRNRLLAKR